jgi:hypothetical protein
MNHKFQIGDKVRILPEYGDLIDVHMLQQDDPHAFQAMWEIISDNYEINKVKKHQHFVRIKRLTFPFNPQNGDRVLGETVIETDQLAYYYNGLQRAKEIIEGDI